jgi:hypothetical protein
MTLTIELSPTEEARLLAAARNTGVAPSDFAKTLMTEHLPPTSEERDDPTLALFAQWEKEDAAMTPEETEADRLLWEKFQANVNETRRALGMMQL